MGYKIQPTLNRKHKNPQTGHRWVSSTVGENPSANAGNVGCKPALGRFHLPRSTWAPAPQSLRPADKPQRDACAPRLETCPQPPRRERACTKQRRPGAAKNKETHLEKGLGGKHNLKNLQTTVKFYSGTNSATSWLKGKSKSIFLASV